MSDRKITIIWWCVCGAIMLLGLLLVIGAELGLTSWAAVDYYCYSVFGAIIALSFLLNLIT